MNVKTKTIDKEKLNMYSRRSYAQKIINDPDYILILRQRALNYYRLKHPNPKPIGRPHKIKDENTTSAQPKKLGRPRLDDEMKKIKGI
jgi:sensor histidine kinase regulating citrate/malate metabolism